MILDDYHNDKLRAIVSDKHNCFGKKSLISKWTKLNDFTQMISSVEGKTFLPPCGGSYKYSVPAYQHTNIMRAANTILCF